MKISDTRLCYVLPFFVSMAWLVLATPADGSNPFKLKPGAQGEICLKCHETFKKTLENPYLHPLLKAGKCSGCHDPHTSSHNDLLAAQTTKLCSGCHAKVLPAKPKSAHDVVQKGECKKCHDVHGSQNPSILLKSGNELCFECHEDVGNQTKKSRFRHRPLQTKKGCLTCHSPHASEKFNALLNDEAPRLCTKCHEAGSTSFQKKHMGYPVAKSDCVSCHDPHGSSRKGMLFDDAHVPVKNKQCAKCHDDPSAPNPLRTKEQGIALCKQCHQRDIEKTFKKNRVHWPLVDKRGCLNCHAPHASKEEKLLETSKAGVCGKCHWDTVQLQEWSRTDSKNKKLCEPVRAGDCVACHSPHGADNVLLIEEKAISTALCGRCHEWQTHSTHPIGEKAIDQRNRNLTVECLSCHKACGTGNKPSMMPFGTVYELCIQCHVERKR